MSFSLVFSCILYIVFKVLISCCRLFTFVLGSIFLIDSSLENDTCPLDSGFILLFLDTIIGIYLSALAIVFLLMRSAAF